MRQKVGPVPAFLAILGVLVCAATAYYLLTEREAAPQKEPSVASAMSKLRQLTPEQRREIGRKAEEAAKSYGR